MPSLSLFFLAHSSWASLASLLLSRFSKWDETSACVFTCNPKHQGTHFRLTQTSYLSTASTLMYSIWVSTVPHVFSRGVTHQYLLESHTQSLPPVFLEHLSLGLGAELSPHQEEGEHCYYAWKFVTFLLPPNLLSFLLCRLGGVRSKNYSGLWKPLSLDGICLLFCHTL